MAEQQAFDKELKLALSQIEKTFGKGAIMQLGEDATAEVQGIPTGSISLDLALGGKGLPRGRIIEIYGPESSGKTTIALHAVANAQRLGGVAAFIDAEHALDPSWARRLGVNLEALLVSQPSSGEEGLKIAEMLVKSNAVDIIVIDSVAALVPKAEVEGEIGDSHVGLQARLMSQALRILNPVIAKTKTCIIFINQIRQKIGVMFGCFHYNARVMLADGTSEKIGKIVNQRMPVEVLSYNTETGAIEPRRVINWFDNGVADHFLQFEVEGGPSGRRRFAVTPNHLIFTPQGEVPAGELQEGDEVLAEVTDYVLSDDQAQLVLGSLLGDGSLRQAGIHSANFRIGHGHAQKEYAAWKHQVLFPFARALGPVGNGVGFDTLAFPTLADWRKEAYTADGSRTVSTGLLEKLDARGVAVWYSDDGTYEGHYQRWGRGKAVLCNASLRGADRDKVAQLFERLGVGRPKDFPHGFRFTAEQTARLHEMLAPYTHPAVAYKLHPTLRNQFIWEPPSRKLALEEGLLARKVRRTVAARINRIYVKPPTRSMHRFDIEVEGNHTYLVDGVVVHNSPETTAGGLALKFYASVRLEVRKISSVKEGEETTGSRIKAKVVKNKIAPPFRSAEFDLMYDRGISMEGDLLDLAIEEKLVEKSGAWINYGSTRLGQGRENAKQFLKENPAITEELTQKVMAKRKPVEELPGTEEEETETPPEAAAPPTPPPTRGRRAAAEKSE
jgi:recombination protein RecA